MPWRKQVSVAIQKQLDRDLLLRANASSAGNLGLYLIVYFSLHLNQSSSPIAWFSGSLIVCSALLRFWISNRYFKGNPQRHFH